jgi:protein-S-isoprenylcysteine O-methyltransferase Ste14
MNERSPVKTSRILPPTYLLIAILLMVALHLVLPVVMIVPNPWNLLGIIPIAAGVYIATAAEGSFHKAKTTVSPFVESTMLITDGMFRLSRNPMYLGFVLTLAGIALLFRSLTPFLVIPVFVVLIQRMFIQAEEQMLTARFGERYAAYSRNTPRWL